MQVFGSVSPGFWHEPKGKKRYPNCWKTKLHQPGIRADEDSVIKAFLELTFAMECAGKEVEVYGAVHAYASIFDGIAVVTVYIATPWRKSVTLGNLVCEADEFVIDREDGDDVFRLLGI